MKVLLAGASGLIGTALHERLRADHMCRTLSRAPMAAAVPGYYSWTGKPGSVPPGAVEWADAVISLNGASLGHVPWTSAYRRQIMASRIDATAAIAQAIAESSHPPAVWLSASAVGYYGDRGDESLTEGSPAGSGFLAEVTKVWEQTALPAGDKTRLVTLRTGLVISAQGALKPLFLATRLGVGASVGGGRAWWPWVSLDDEIGGIVHALEDETIGGPVNIVGPAPARSGEITATLARLMRRPYLLRLPKAVLRATLGQAADELLLASQRVVPAKLTAAGYAFRHPTVADAIAAAI